jgi:ribosome maturation factor RimP
LKNRKLTAPGVGLAGVELKAGDIVQRVRALVEPVTDDLGLELVDLLFVTERGRLVLRIFIDKPGGVSLDDCSRLSRELGTVLDVEDIIEQSYSLEVSSPGLDRPLKREKDFIRAMGKKINIRTKKALEDRRNFKAILDDVQEGKLFITDSEGRKWEIKLENIEKARREVVI